MTGMGPRRFEWLLRTRGPAVAAWPEPDRADALELLRCSEDARSLLATVLAAEDAPEPDAAAQRRVRGAVRRALSPPPPVLRGIRWGVVAACVAAGLYLGLPQGDPDWAAELGPAMRFSSSSSTVLAALDE